MYFHLEKVREKGSFSAVRNATCQHCGSEFHYPFVCIAEGSATTVSGINREGAARRAAEIASIRARKRAATAVVPVACPSCGKLQDDMVKVLREQLIARHAMIGWTIPAVLVGIAGGAALLVSDFLNEPLSMAWTIGLSVIGAVAVVLCAWFGLRIWLEARELQPHYFGRMKVATGIPGHAAPSAERPTPPASAADAAGS